MPSSSPAWAWGKATWASRWATPLARLLGALHHRPFALRYLRSLKTGIDAINTLAAAHASGRLKSDLSKYLKPRLLILDELGYLPIDKKGADLLFQIISGRYERGYSRRLIKAS